MRKCRKCGCNCDNADIIDGICNDCRNETDVQKEKQKMPASKGIQMDTTGRKGIKHGIQKNI